MAVRKQGSRRIEVDGVTYLWRVPRRSSDTDGNIGLITTVQYQDRRGSVLVIYFPQQHPDIASTFGEPAVPVLPSQVADAIRRAVVAGWRPTEGGPRFAISGAGTRPEPPGSAASSLS
jgi:hypothetical protein